MLKKKSFQSYPLEYTMTDLLTKKFHKQHKETYVVKYPYTWLPILTKNILHIEIRLNMRKYAMLALSSNMWWFKND